jgi:hypothetical protein
MICKRENREEVRATLVAIDRTKLPLPKSHNHDPQENESLGQEKELRSERQRESIDNIA